MTEPSSVAPTSISPADASTQSAAAKFMSDLRGRWVGEGINTLWVPTPNAAPAQPQPPMYTPTPGQPQIPLPRFVSSRTTDTLVIEDALGSVPNKGSMDEFSELASPYADRVYDENGNLVHAENGFWLVTPETKLPPTTAASVSKLASIPHGTVALVQGDLPAEQNGQTRITVSRTAPVMPSNPPAELTAPTGPLAPQFITNVAAYVQQRFDADLTGLLWQLDLTSIGVANTSFLNANARVSSVQTTYWLGNLGIRADSVGAQVASVLAYIQTTLINFDGIDWPHISVGYLLRDMDRDG